MPLLADLKPSGRYVMEDLHKVGGSHQPHSLASLAQSVHQAAPGLKAERCMAL